MSRLLTESCLLFCGYHRIAQGDKFGLGGIELLFGLKNQVGCRAVAARIFRAHRGEFCIEGVGYLPTRRQPRGAGSLGIIAGLAIEAVERTNFAIVGQEVDTERRAEPTRMYRPEYSRMEENSLHFL